LNVERDLLSNLSNLTYEKLSSDVVNRVKTILLHDLVVGMIGRKSEEVRFASNYYQGENLLDRIFLRGLEMSTPTLEDFYGANHFGPLIIPNALYHGVDNQASGKRFLVAVVVGFEIAIFLNDLLGELVTSKGFRGTPLFGTMAAVAAASYVSQSSEDEWSHALAHAYTNAFGVGISLLEGTSEWRFQAALGAYHAGLSYLLSRHGFEGYSKFLSGHRGFSDIFAGQRIENSINRTFNGSSLLKVGVKRHPVNIFVMNAVEAAKRFVQKFGHYSPDMVDMIRIKVPTHQFPQMILQKGPYLKTDQAIVSIFTTTALTLLYGDCTLLSKANDREVLQLIDKIEVMSEDTFRSFELEMSLSTNTNEHVIFIQDHQSLYFPSFAQEKAHLLTEANRWGIDQARVVQLAHVIENLDKLDSLTELIQTYEK
jgi:2-methylcitrate dehydratase PrpD